MNILTNENYIKAEGKKTGLFCYGTLGVPFFYTLPNKFTIGNPLDFGCGFQV